MPQMNVESLMSEPKRIRGLPLCFYGCPRAAANRQRSVDSGSGGRSSSGSGSYYKSNCPAFPPPEPDNLSTPSPASSSSVEEPQSDSVQPADFSGSLSAEFLEEDEDEEEDMSPESSSIPLASDVIAGNTRRRHRASSHESNGGGTTAVICASLNSVHRVLRDSTVVGYRLRLPGEDNFTSSPSSAGGDSYIPSDANFAHVMNSALTSQSAPISRYHSAFVYLVVILIMICR